MGVFERAGGDVDVVAGVGFQIARAIDGDGGGARSGDLWVCRDGNDLHDRRVV